MSGIMIASMVLLWIAVVVLAVLVFALARQVGLLHTRLAPAGALMTSAGPKVGEEAPRLELDTVSGDPVVIGGPQEQHQLVFFISPKCPICKSLVPVAQSLLKADKRLSLVFASDGGEPEQHQRYVRDLGIEAFPYVVSLELGMKFEVGKLPYAVLISSDGVLRSKGLVNSREHLESLVESMDSGFPSIQEYIAANGNLEKLAS